MSQLATVSAIDDNRTHALMGRRRGDSERQFARARRHSRRVRRLRIGVPAVVVAGFGVYLLIGYLNPLHLLRIPATVGSLVVSGTKIRMEQPKLAGFTRDARAYEMTADSAAQDIMSPDKMELQGVRAKFETPDHAMVNVTAENGFYDSKADQMRLSKNVLITSTSGYEVTMSEAAIDMHDSHVVSDKPVAVKMLNGHINSNGLEVINSGEVLRFTGGVSMTIAQPPPLRAQAEADQD